MDKFEQVTQQMDQMHDQDRVKMTEEKKKLCICSGCPTYNDCAKNNNELLYCALGKSPTCITKELGCIYPSCSITEQMRLIKEFFCSRGFEMEQRGL